MALETDLLLDRARLKRRITFWRVFAILAVAVMLLVVVGSGAGRHGPMLGGRQIARVSINGIITDNQDLTGQIDALATNPTVSAVILSIDSPGGSVSGGESLHDAIATVAARKPVVAVMRGTAASAAYMLAVPASRIFARQSTITGSIGVIMETGEVSGLLQKLGISATQIVSGPLKGQPSATEPLTPAAHDVLQAMVSDLYDQFVSIVAEGRHMDPARVRALADGRAYTGRQALPLGLIDQFGGEREARQWLAQAHDIPLNVPVNDLGRKNWMQRRFAAASGTDDPSFAEMMENIFFGQRVTLDGPVALWQP